MPGVVFSTNRPRGSHSGYCLPDGVHSLSSYFARRLSADQATTLPARSSLANSPTHWPTSGNCSIPAGTAPQVTSGELLLGPTQTSLGATETTRPMNRGPSPSPVVQAPSALTTVRVVAPRSDLTRRVGCHLGDWATRSSCPTFMVCFRLPAGGIWNRNAGAPRAALTSVEHRTRPSYARHFGCSSGIRRRAGWDGIACQSDVQSGAWLPTHRRRRSPVCQADLRHLP